MSFAFTDATIWLAGYDFTGDSNELALNLSTDELDATAFGSTYRTRIAGLRNTEMTVGGYWQSAAADAVDPQVFPNLGVADRVITLAPTAAETSTAYMFQGAKFSYSMFGVIGAVTPFTLGVKGSNGVGTVRGQVAKAKANVSATGPTGSGLNLGAVSAIQHLYATFHVFGTPGTTITAVVESAAADTFVGATTRITFGPITAAGGTWGTRVAGPITDTWYRLNITSVTGTFLLAGAIGIR